MKLCIHCRHYEPAKPWGWRDVFRVADPWRFKDRCNNVDVDRVTGEARRVDAQWMRAGDGYGSYMDGPCGKDALLFEPK